MKEFTSSKFIIGDKGYYSFRSEKNYIIVKRHGLLAIILARNEDVQYV